MSESSTRAQEKRESYEESMPMHYFDACTLGVEKFTGQITNASKHGFRPATSHLALGEAIGSELFKLKEIEEALKKAKSTHALERLTKEKEAKTELINHIIAIANKMNMLGNDVPSGILKQFMEDSSPIFLETADALNIATAINAGCEKFFTTDSNFQGEKFKENVKNISKKHNAKTLEVIYIKRS